MEKEKEKVWERVGVRVGVWESERDREAGGVREGGEGESSCFSEEEIRSSNF